MTLSEEGGQRRKEERGKGTNPTGLYWATLGERHLHSKLAIKSLRKTFKLIWLK